MTEPLSDAFVREAFNAAGEKRYILARLAYPYFLGTNWRWALVGWAYIKCLDDLVDEDEASESAIKKLKAQMQLLEQTYAGSLPDPGLSKLESYGQKFFAWDRGCGAPLRSSVEMIIETMEFDLRRRGLALPREEIDAYIIKMGGAIADYFTHFAMPGRKPSAGLKNAGIRAYLYADTLMDLAHDLKFGLINIPAEDLESEGIYLTKGFEACREWVALQAPRVEGHFDEAINLMREMPGCTRLWCRFLLNRKRKAFRRFLDDILI